MKLIFSKIFLKCLAKFDDVDQYLISQITRLLAEFRIHTGDCFVLGYEILIHQS